MTCKFVDKDGGCLIRGWLRFVFYLGVVFSVIFLDFLCWNFVEKFEVEFCGKI